MAGREITIAVLADHQSWHVADLHRAAGEMLAELGAAGLGGGGMAIVQVAWKDIAAAVGQGGGSPSQRIVAGRTQLHEIDAVIPRSIGAASLEQVVFRMDVLHRLEAMGVPVVNSPLAIEIAVDKYRSLARMQAAGLRVPETFTCQTAADAVHAFAALGGDVVLKPIFGAEGHGVRRLRDAGEAKAVFEEMERGDRVIYLQRFIDAKQDLRLFVVGDKVVASMMRMTCDWPSNIAQGGEGRRASPSASIQAMAVAAARACDALVVGVDILVDRDDRQFVLEANASPGWRKLAEVSAVDIARMVLQATLPRTPRAIQ